MKKHPSRKKIFDALSVGTELRMTSTVWRIESIDRLSARLACVASRVPANPVNMATESLIDGIIDGTFVPCGKAGER